MRTMLPDNLLPLEYPSPAVKWAGGKADVADQILPLLPADVRARRWHEPFVGGAALFLRIAPRKAILSDTCADLITLYEVLQTVGDESPFWAQLVFLETLHNAAHAGPGPKANYEEVRKAFNARTLLSNEHRAAAFLYLNKAGFNGLHRVNEAGEFNVPFGDAKRIQFNRETLSSVGRAMQGAELLACSFESVLERATPGDVVYFDPPYLGTFSDYSSRFGIPEHIELARVFRALDAKRVIVVLSINDTPYIKELYQGLDITPVTAPRAIGARGSSRGYVRELVIRGKCRG